MSGQNAALRPVSVVSAQAVKFNGSLLAAEYYVIAPAELAGTAQELADYRQGKGLKSVVVTLEDIYDVYNYGVPSPLAIRDFLADGFSNGSGKNVKYAVLAGKGTYDYNDYGAMATTWSRSFWAEHPKDCARPTGFLVMSAASDGLPEIAVGRLPAVTNAELKTMIDKVKAYESGQGAWTSKAIFIADNSDDGGDFAQGCNDLAGLATGLQAEKVYLAGSVQETRAKINRFLERRGGAGQLLRPRRHQSTGH